MIMLNSTKQVGWNISLLDQITNRGSGHTPNKQTAEYWNGGISWVSLSDCNKLDQRYIDSTDKKISVEGIKHSSAVLHPANTVIISRDAGVGKSAILQSEMAVSQHFIAWDCNQKKILLPLFLYYVLQLNKEEFERQAFGSTIKTIGLPYFKKLGIC
jgi:type I restriction enzyme S subunit